MFSFRIHYEFIHFNILHITKIMSIFRSKLVIKKVFHFVMVEFNMVVMCVIAAEIYDYNEKIV